MLTRTLLMAGAALTLAGGIAAASADEPTFMAQLQQASARAPTRLPEAPAMRIVTGNFDHKHRLDAVVLSERGTAFCKGPDYRKCIPLAHLPVGRSLAITDTKGKAAILQYDSASLGQVCTISTFGERASLDCRPMNFARLQDYGAQSVADGKVLAVESLDGTYFCSEMTGAPKCGLIKGKDGVLPRIGKRQRSDTKFTPQPGKTCTFKQDGFDCVVSEFDSLPRSPFALPALIQMEREIDGEWDSWMMNEIDRDCPWGCGDPAWFDYRFAQEPKPCESTCLTWYEHDTSVCYAAGAIGAARGGTQIGGAVFAICMGVANVQKQYCYWRCG